MAPARSPHEAAGAAVTSVHNLRWEYLVMAAAALEEQRTTVRQVLDGAADMFHRGLEPHEEFEAYAVRRLVLALRRSLDAA